MPERIAAAGIGVTMGEIVLDGVLYAPADLAALVAEVEAARAVVAAARAFLGADPRGIYGDVREGVALDEALAAYDAAVQEAL